jgi:ketosteroid isomerase-like protein
MRAELPLRYLPVAQEDLVHICIPPQGRLHWRFSHPHERTIIMRLIALCLLCCFLCLAGCTHTPSLEEAKALVHLQNEKLHTVVATKNLALLREVYAEDAWFMAPRLAPVHGRDSIIALWGDGLDQTVSMHSESLEINGTPDVLYEIGIVTNVIRTGSSDSVVVHKAKYTNVWKRDSAGVYRLTVDIFNRID